MTFRRHFCLLATGAIAMGAIPAAAADQKIDFNRDIRPIFSQKCFMCHGPDEAERKGGSKKTGGLRLDTPEGAAVDLGGYQALVPGDPEKSELFYRIITDDDDELMPPAKHGGRLSEGEIDLIKRWIKQGGKYAVHWSYQKPEKPEVPQITDKGYRLSNPIDHFAAEKLIKEGLKQSPEADRYALARRVALDLTGLPPTLEEADAFVADTRPDAYSRYVDLMLSKSAYGEHWARMWLDLARYADSAGYADDPARTIWAFRDYVIRSFNSNKPFDKFTIEQIAGDLLESPSEEELVATAFHRNTQTNNEGGTNDEEFRNVAVADRVNTTMAVWMGTTMVCAQCHTHKYDPITHEDYYRMYAILNNTEDADRRNEAPTISVAGQAHKEQQAKLDAELAAFHAELIKGTPERLTKLRDWEKSLKSNPTNWSPLKWTETKAESGATLTSEKDGALLVSGKAAKTDTYQLSATTELSQLTGIKLEVLPHESLGQEKGPGRQGNFVLNDLSVVLIPPGESAAQGRFVRIDLAGEGKMIHVAEVEVFSGSENVALKGKATQSSTDFGGPAHYAIDGKTDGRFDAKSTTHTAISKDPWWEVDLGSQKAVSKIVVWNRTDANIQSRLDGFKLSVLDEKRNTVWEKTFAKAPAREVASELSGARSVKLVNASASYEQANFGAALAINGDSGANSGWAVGGHLGQPSTAVFATESPIELPAGTKIQLSLAQNYENHALGHFRILATGDKSPQPILPDTITQIIAKPEASRSAEEKTSLLRFFADYDPAVQSKLTEFDARKKKLEAASKAATTVPVMRELPEGKRRKTHIQLRGNFLDKGDEVTAGLPSAFHPVAEKSPDRMVLAKWLVDKNNPLTARVIANRYWEALFGTGIVSTSEEFGSQGEPPTHPELLDWLAIELIDSGWDLKKFLKLIVMSDTYRQASAVTEAAYERDPRNQLLARGPRFRVSAEMVRDQALAVSGLLSPKMYGPPVKPPQPNMGLKAAFGSGTDWKTSAGEDKHRRGIYTTWRRSSPYPSMAAFDAPNREVCTVRRDRTNTPLQALVTLNDPVYIEAAQALARRMMAADGSAADKAALGFRLCLTRKPTERELTVITDFYTNTKARYQDDKDRAMKMATDPIGPLPEGADPVDAAAWTVLANTLLNLDEMFLKR